MELHNIIREIGMPQNILGARYWRVGIEMAQQDHEMLDNICGFYEAVAQRIGGTTGSRVERAMRHALDVTFDRIQLDVCYKYFGNSIDPSKGKPTNSEFLGAILTFLEQDDSVHLCEDAIRLLNDPKFRAWVQGKMILEGIYT